MAVFGGFTPSDSPALVILVSIDEPKGIPYGGIAAAPVFSEVGTWTLNYLNVAPSFPPDILQAGQQNLSHHIKKDERTAVLGNDVLDSMPNFLGLGMRDVLSKAKQLGLRVIIEGSGMVVNQVPEPGKPLKDDRVVNVTFQPPR